MKFSISASILVFASCAAAHSAMVSIVGDADRNSVGRGMGIDVSTPRDGTGRQPFQRDSAILRDREVGQRASACGRTLQGGKIDVDAEVQRSLREGIARVRSGGLLTMSMHQVNGDGAGPFSCTTMSADGTPGEAIEVTQQVPGQNARSRARATDFPLTVRTSANQPRFGPNNDIIMVRCRNTARAGPFGGCAIAQVVN